MSAQERDLSAPSGLLMLFVLIVGMFAVPAACAAFVAGMHPAAVVVGLVVTATVLLEIAIFISLGGFFTVAPNEARVLQLFGDYVGTCRQQGLRWANPFYSKKRISQRVRNFETTHLKVNDLDGNPIELGAVVVWKVVNTFEAMFHVDDYEKFVHVQSEAALRNLATRYPYDMHDEHTVSLRGHTQTIAHELQSEIQERLKQAGVHVIEARISHLAYAPEIAGAMLQRQQAGAIIAARQRIVDGAVGMVELALKKLADHHIVELDGDRKAQMVSNLLVVLCGDRHVQPVINTGSIYQ